MFNFKCDHPFLVHILELCRDSTKDGKEIVFTWVPGHADSAAKDALVGDISVELVPFSDIKASTNKYILDLWQLEWNEFLENKLHKIFPDLRQCTILFVLRQTEKRKLIA